MVFEMGSGGVGGRAPAVVSPARGAKYRITLAKIVNFRPHVGNCGVSNYCPIVYRLCHTTSSFFSSGFPSATGPQSVAPPGWRHARHLTAPARSRPRYTMALATYRPWTYQAITSVVILFCSFVAGRGSHFTWKRHAIFRYRFLGVRRGDAVHGFGPSRCRPARFRGTSRDPRGLPLGSRTRNER